MTARRAVAVVMTGSHARGNAHQESDLDLVAIVRRKPSEADRQGWLRPYRVSAGTLVAVAWETPASARQTFRSPRLAPTFVPGWREAIILADPEGLAARLKRAAERWTWDSIARASDEYAAERTTGLAEEVHKLAGTLQRGDGQVAAAQRSILAVYLAEIMAVRHRILFGTDNMLWDLVGQHMGPRWAQLQAQAFSQQGESLIASCCAALELYVLAAEQVRPLLSRAQQKVVGHACARGEGGRSHNPGDCPWAAGPSVWCLSLHTPGSLLPADPSISRCRSAMVAWWCRHSTRCFFTAPRSGGGDRGNPGGFAGFDQGSAAAGTLVELTGTQWLKG